MGFQNLPATADTDFTSWQFRVQFAKALRERSGFSTTTPLDVTDEIEGADYIPPESPESGDRWLVLNSDSWATVSIAGQTDTPPTSPSYSLPYGVGNSPTGAWSDHPNCLAQWNGAVWTFSDVADVYQFYKVINTSNYFAFRDGAWIDANGLHWFGHQWQIAQWSGSSWSFSDPVTSPYPTQLFHTADGGIWRWSTNSSKFVAWASAGADAFGLDVTSLQANLWALNPFVFYLPNSVDDYAGVSSAPLPWVPTDFLAEIGIPAEGIGVPVNLVASTPGITKTGQRQAILSGASDALAGHDGQIATALIDNPSLATDYSFETPDVGQLVCMYNYAGYGNSATRAPSWYRKTSSSNFTVDSGGFTRKYPREIQTLLASGEEGQRARFIGKTTADNSTAYSSNWGDVLVDPPQTPASNTYYGVQHDATGAWAGQGGKLARWSSGAWQFTTVSDNTQYLFNCLSDMTNDCLQLSEATLAYAKYGDTWFPVDGSMYDYADGAWTLSDDQLSPADLVVAYGNAQVGDYYGPWIWNELWAAIKLLTRQILSSGWGSLGLAKSRLVGSYSNFDSAKTAVVNLWTSAAAPTTVDHGIQISYDPPSVYSRGGVTGTTSFAAQLYRFHMSHVAFLTVYQSGSGVTLFNGKKGRVDFYVVGRRAYDAAATQNPTSYHAVFANHGNPIAENSAFCWHQLVDQVFVTQSTGVGNNSAVFVSPIFGGDPGNTPPSDAWPTDLVYAGQSFSSYAGWEIKAQFVVADFRVDDGFEYY